MEYPSTDLTLTEGVCTSLVVTAIYVGVLYLPFNTGDRDRRRVIISRMVTLSVLAVCIECYVMYRIPIVIAKAAAGRRVAAIVAGVSLTLLLYVGHVLVTPLRELVTYSILEAPSRAIALRNYVFAPMVEEIVFRRQTLLLWADQTMGWRIIFPSAMFALAHVHHVHRMGVVTMCFHMAYTFLFGIYASALYVSTDTVWAPFAAHVVCNVFELPNFSAIAAHRRSRLISALYAASIALFAVCFQAVTTSFRTYEVAASV